MYIRESSIRQYVQSDANVYRLIERVIRTLRPQPNRMLQCQVCVDNQKLNKIKLLRLRAAAGPESSFK